MVVILNHMQDLILLRFVLSDRPKDSTAHYSGYLDCILDTMCMKNTGYFAL